MLTDGQCCGSIINKKSSGKEKAAICFNTINDKLCLLNLDNSIYTEWQFNAAKMILIDIKDISGSFLKPT